MPVSFSLAGKTALVTGASRGLGRAIAVALADAGADVVCASTRRAGNYLEASASSMFTYALAKGARLGYLDARYRRVAERGFGGLLANLVRENADGTASLINIVQVSGLGGNRRSDGSVRDGSYAYYVSEPVVTDDYKGVGPFILAALELGR